MTILQEMLNMSIFGFFQWDASPTKTRLLSLLETFRLHFVRKKKTFLTKHVLCLLVLLVIIIVLLLLFISFVSGKITRAHAFCIFLFQSI